MRNKKNIITLTILLILPAFILIGVRYVPVDKIPILKNRSGAVSDLLCAYSVKAGSDSLSPFIKFGETVNFSRCFEKEGLEVGHIVVFRDGGALRIGIIRQFINRGRLFYKVSNEKRPQEINDVLPDDVIAVLKTDTSNSQYQPLEKTVTVDDNLENFMSDAYLATIPKGKGIESAPLEKAMQFNLIKDKFCFVFNPIKKLSGVDFVINEKGSEKEYFLAKNALLPIGENINCEEDPFGLTAGRYSFKIFIDKILLKTIEFEIL